MDNHQNEEAFVKDEIERLGAATFGMWDERMLASYCHVSRSTIQKERCRGSGPPYIKRGRLVRYNPIEVIRFYAKHRILPMTS